MIRWILETALLCAAACGLAALPCDGQATAKQPYYLPAHPVDFAAVLMPPPAANSPGQAVDLAAVHQAQQTRTPAAVAQAKADDAEEDIFIYATVLGPDFNATNMPLTLALSQHLRNDVGIVSPPLKAKYRRPRPFLTDTTLHAVCEKKTEGSYPSGHATVGYLTGLVLAQMLSDRADAILARADSYAQDRVVCGVHYPTDIQASRTIALVMLGQIATSPRFQTDVEAARQEIIRNLSSKPRQ